MARSGPVGHKQTPEHIANIVKARKRVMAAKKKLGLSWKDPLPPDHPLASKYRKAAPKKAKANGHDKINGATNAIESALLPVPASGAGTSIPLDIFPDRKPRPTNIKKAAPANAHAAISNERLAKLQLAAALIQTVNKILE
jgi:hypothetical protein